MGAFPYSAWNFDSVASVLAYLFALAFVAAALAQFAVAVFANYLECMIVSHFVEHQGFYNNFEA